MRARTEQSLSSAWSNRGQDTFKTTMGADLYGVNDARFRDSYNSWNVLNKFGLSWWADVLPLLEDDRLLQPEQARALQRMLDRREHVFQENLAKLEETERVFFEKKRDRLRALLEEAIKSEQGIECSL